MSKSVVSLTAIAAVTAAALLSAPAGTRAQSAQEAPRAAAWANQPYLHVEYKADPLARGGTELSGYVYNDNGQAASNVWLEITERDQGGELVGYLTRPVDETIPPKGRAYFDVRVPASASYEIVPQAGEFVQGFGGND